LEQTRKVWDSKERKFFDVSTKPDKKPDNNRNRQTQNHNQSDDRKFDREVSNDNNIKHNYSNNNTEQRNSRSSNDFSNNNSASKNNSTKNKNGAVVNGEKFTNISGVDNNIGRLNSAGAKPPRKQQNHDQNQLKTNVPVPDYEFDFSAANAKFQKDDNEQQIPDAFYQKSSFFDDISTDFKDRETFKYFNF
jgi:hypothetical protein